MRTSVLILLSFAICGLAAAEDTPRQAAEKAAAQEMAKARAEKARNDAIVEKQRERERGRREAERLERAQKKGRTG